MSFLRLAVLLSFAPVPVLAATPPAENPHISAPLPCTAEPAAQRLKHGVFGNLGFFSAVGFAGLSYAYAPSEQSVLEAGVGYGLTGLQLSLMPKYTIGKIHRLVLGLGPSLGMRLDQNGTGLWLNGDAGYEVRADNGMSITLVIGFTKGITGCIAERCRPGGGGWGDDSEARAYISERAADYQSVQTRVIVGKWF